MSGRMSEWLSDTAHLPHDSAVSRPKTVLDNFLGVSEVRPSAVEQQQQQLLREWSASLREVSLMILSSRIPICFLLHMVESWWDFGAMVGFAGFLLF